jgi:hypothetical protein
MTYPQSVTAGEIAEVGLKRALNHYGLQELLRQVVQLQAERHRDQSGVYLAAGQSDQRPKALIDAGLGMVDDGYMLLNLASKLIAEADQASNKSQGVGCAR